jgi:hypothetical protein
VDVGEFMGAAGFSQATSPTLVVQNAVTVSKAEPHAAIRRSPSQSVRNPTTWFQLGVIRDAGPEIANGLGAFLYAARSKPGFGRAFFL